MNQRKMSLLGGAAGKESVVTKQLKTFKDMRSKWEDRLSERELGLEEQEFGENKSDRIQR